MSREIAETRLRQDIETAWEPWHASDTIAVSRLARRVRDALEPALIAEFKNAARDLLLKFIEPDGIDESELDQLAEDEMTPHSAEIGRMVGDTTEKWAEEDENPVRAFSRERAELIAITEITRARTQGEFAAAALLDEIGIPLVGRWYTEEDERVCQICGPLHKTLEKYWSQFFPKGSPAHGRCRCRIDWKEKAKRKPKVKRSAPVGRLGRRRRARTRSRESVQWHKVIKPAWSRLQEGCPVLDTQNENRWAELLKEHKPDFSKFREMGRKLAEMREKAILDVLLSEPKK